MSRLSRRLAAYAPDPVQVVTTGQSSPAPLPVMADGLLDRAPSPYGPDPAVFGGWYLMREPSVGGNRLCRGCGCAQADGLRPCWCCGAMVTP